MATKTERTKPGSKLDFRVTYDSGNKKWTNDKPGDGKGDPDEKENLFDDSAVKRGIDRLEKAISAYAGGKGGPGAIKKAVEKMELYAGVDAARTAVRAVYKAVNGKDGGGKATEGAKIAKDHANRDRKKASMGRTQQIAERVAHSLMADQYADSILERFNEMVDAGAITDERLIEKVRRSPLSLARRPIKWTGTGFGGLGQVSFDNMYLHWKAGVRRHKWEWDGSVGHRDPKYSINMFKCRICRKKVNKAEKTRM